MEERRIAYTDVLSRLVSGSKRPLTLFGLRNALVRDKNSYDLLFHAINVETPIRPDNEDHLIVPTVRYDEESNSALSKMITDYQRGFQIFAHIPRETTSTRNPRPLELIEVGKSSRDLEGLTIKKFDEKNVLLVQEGIIELGTSLQDKVYFMRGEFNRIYAARA